MFTFWSLASGYKYIARFQAKGWDCEHPRRMYMAGHCLVCGEEISSDFTRGIFIHLKCMPKDRETLKDLIEKERERMEHTDRSYCKGCNIAVGTHDPTRIQRGLEVWHQSCWDKKRKEAANEAAVLQARIGNIRSYWGLRSMSRVH